MIKIRLIVRNCMTVMIISLICALLIGGYRLSLILQTNAFFEENTNDIYTLVVYASNYINIENVKYLYPIMGWMLYPTLITHRLGEYVSDYYNKNSTLVFSRYGSRIRLYIINCFLMAIYIVIGNFIYILTCFLLGRRFGFVGEFVNSDVLVIFALSCLYMYMIQLSINVLSLYIKSLFSTLFVYFVLILNITAPYYLGSKIKTVLLRYGPASQGIYLLHDRVKEPSVLLYGEEYSLGQFDIKFSVVYLSVLILLTQTSHIKMCLCTLKIQ